MRGGENEGGGARKMEKPMRKEERKGKFER